MSTVSGDPDEMQGYVRDVDEVRDAAYRARERLIDAYEELAAALPAGHPAPDRPNVAGPLGRSRRVDELVGEVAERLRTAGEGRSDGTYTLDAAALAVIPYTSPYGAALRSRLAQRAELELARLRERMASGSYDETTAGELVAVLGWMRHEIDTAADPQAAAAELIDMMGPGDLQEIERLVVSAYGEEGDDSWVDGAVGDLAVVVSHGLEPNPERAERWVAEIDDDHDWYHDGPPPLLVALGTLAAPTTVVLTRTVWRHVWDHTYDDATGAAVLAHRGPEGGTLDRLVGTPNAIEALAGSAGERPALANALVLDVAEEGFADFEHLLAQGGTTNPPLGGEATYEALGSMLTASVDVSLPMDARLLAASQTLDMYDTALREDDPVYFYAPEVQTGLATMTQPLLARLHPESEQILLPGGGLGGAGDLGVDGLERVVRDLATSEAGVQGLGTALDGATSEVLVNARVRAAATEMPEPVDPQELRRAGHVMNWMVSTATNERLQGIVDSIEGGGISDAMQTAMLDGLGATRMEPVSVVVKTALAATGEEHIAPANVLGGNPGARLTYQLVLLNLDARPDIASPELVAALQGAVTPDGADGPSGAEGVSLFLSDTEGVDHRDYPGLYELRELVADQRTLINVEGSSLLARAFDVG